MLCATKGQPGEVYNLASGVETSIGELAALVNRETENPTPIENLPPRTWDHSGKRFGSTEKSKRELGFAPEVGLQDGLRQTIAWTREHLSFIDACIEKHRAHLTPADTAATTTPAQSQPASQQRQSA
jgi:nucleoside-diphosphate-sugar epimerase